MVVGCNDDVWRGTPLASCVMLTPTNIYCNIHNYIIMFFLPSPFGASDNIGDTVLLDKAHVSLNHHHPYPTFTTHNLGCILTVSSMPFTYVVCEGNALTLRLGIHWQSVIEISQDSGQFSGLQTGSERDKFNPYTIKITLSIAEVVTYIGQKVALYRCF